jgi:parallel beta helix pectate lyase-like protein
MQFDTNAARRCSALFVAVMFVWQSDTLQSTRRRSAVADEIRVNNRDELVDALRAAKPGTRVAIAAGSYQGGLSQAKLAGTKEHPIVIAGADRDHPPVIEGGSSGLHLSSPAHVELRDLVIQGSRGNGLNIDDSGSTETPANDLMLRNIVVRNIGPDGNRDGIKLSGLRDFRIEGCRVERWGSGGSAIDMVGCTGGIITKCKFSNATGDAANGVQTKGGSSDIVIQHCRFENAGGRGVNIGGSTGLAYFRPRDATYEARNITVEDCEFIGGMAAVAFVGVDGAVVQHNTIYRPRRWPIRILQENTDSRFTRCRNGKLIDNVIAFRSDEVREVFNIGPNTAPETFTISGNVWCCLDRPDDTRRLVRTPAAENKGTYGPVPKFKDAEHGDIRILDRGADNAGVRE